MKKTKRNIAIIVVLLFVCAAIYFNWSYNTQWGKADAEMAAAERGGGQGGGGSGRSVGVGIR